MAHSTRNLMGTLSIVNQILILPTILTMYLIHVRKPLYSKVQESQKSSSLATVNLNTNMAQESCIVVI